MSKLAPPLTTASTSGEAAALYRRTVKSYVRRTGRTTSGQTRALQQLAPLYVLPFAPRPLDFTHCFGRAAPTLFEIGFGMGEATANVAARMPQHNFLACDVVEGALAHQDNMGRTEVIPAGDVQRMSAGRGVMHSEFNHAKDQTTHLLQIWILPSEQGIAPGYQQTAFTQAQKRGRLRLVASPDGADGSVSMHADARLYAGLFDAGETATLQLDPGRKGYLHVVRGEIRVNDQALGTGDAALLAQEIELRLDRASQAEVLFFDLCA